jgi:adenosylmethionine-8-amino-7-oxononanoate aminotransferase
MELFMTVTNDNHIWYPFTQHKISESPIIIEKAKGSYLYDIHGKAYLDLISSWWVNLFGHSHPELNQALQQQVEILDHVIFAGFTHQPALQLASSLIQLVGEPFTKVFFSDNGSTSVEVALKLSYQYWKNLGENKSIFLCLDGGYHGDTFGAMAVGKGSNFFKPFNDLFFETITLPYPIAYINNFKENEKIQNCLQYAFQIIDKYKNKIAAIIFEPLLQGAGGMRYAKAEFFNELCNYAKKNHILIIHDEVAVGFGRLGRKFAFEYLNYKPDFLCLSKGITAGYLPLAVTITNDTIFNAFLDNKFYKAFAHGHSYTANPLSCAIALKSLELLQRKETLEQWSIIQNCYYNFIQELQLNYKHIIKHIRSIGNILAFDINNNDETYQSNISESLKKLFLENGLNLRPLGNTIYFMPPYCITKQQLEDAFDKVLYIINKLIKSL